jgi:hypothetical protein
MPKETEPTKRSLREIPEVDFSKAKRLPRGKYAEKARRTFAIAIVEPELFARFGSSDALNAALRAVVEEADAVKYPAKAKRVATRSTRLRSSLASSRCERGAGIATRSPRSARRNGGTSRLEPRSCALMPRRGARSSAGPPPGAASSV